MRKRCGYTRQDTGNGWKTACGKEIRNIGRGWLFCPFCGDVIYRTADENYQREVPDYMILFGSIPRDLLEDDREENTLTLTREAADAYAGEQEAKKNRRKNEQIY